MAPKSLLFLIVGVALASAVSVAVQGTAGWANINYPDINFGMVNSGDMLKFDNKLATSDMLSYTMDATAYQNCNMTSFMSIATISPSSSYTWTIPMPGMFFVAGSACATGQKFIVMAGTKQMRSKTMTVMPAMGWAAGVIYPDVNTLKAGDMLTFSQVNNFSLKMTTDNATYTSWKANLCPGSAATTPVTGGSFTVLNPGSSVYFLGSCGQGFALNPIAPMKSNPATYGRTISLETIAGSGTVGTFVTAVANYLLVDPTRIMLMSGATVMTSTALPLGKLDLKIQDAMGQSGDMLVNKMVVDSVASSSFVSGYTVARVYYKPSSTMFQFISTSSDGGARFPLMFLGPLLGGIGGVLFILFIFLSCWLKSEPQPGDKVETWGEYIFNCVNCCSCGIIGRITKPREGADKV